MSGRADMPAPRAGAEVVARAAPGVPFRPLHCDWAWRPAPWASRLSGAAVDWVQSGHALSGDVSLHHDASSACRIACSQMAQPEGPADQALSLTAEGFDGSFLSLALELPPAAWQGLRPDHLLGVWLALTEEGGGVYLRLNIRHGPNHLQLLRHVPPGSGADAGGVLTEFDLICTPFNEKRVSQIWCDLILGDEGSSGAVLRDVSLTRRPRAAI